MFGEEIGRIVFTSHLHEAERVIPDTLLDLEALCIDMSELTKPLSSTYAYCGNAAGPNPQGKVQPQIAKERTVSQTDS